MAYVNVLSPEDLQDLLLKISAGDEIAFRKLFNYFRKQVYSYALKITKSNLAAEDILHDVFLKIWQNKDQNKIEDPERYLKVATRNLALNVLRRQRLEIKANEELGHYFEDAHNDTEDSIQFNETNKLLQKAIEQLPPQQKAVYNLCKVEGLKYHQAAERLSLSPLTVKTHMQHALRFLRVYVGKNTDVVMYVILLQILEKNN